jgi:hypothetical protein
MNLSEDCAPKPKKPPGRPPLNFTAEHRARVVELATLGVPQDQIAFDLRISVHTLRKHFRNELYDSAIAANCAILKKLYDLAVNGNASAATFWARTRCKFRVGGSFFDEEATQTKPPATSVQPDLEVSNNDGAPREEW